MHVFFGCRVANEIWLNSFFLHLMGMFMGPQVTLPSILGYMLEWLAKESSRFAYILWGIWNSINNMLFQQKAPNSLHIVLQAFGPVKNI